MSGWRKKRDSLSTAGSPPGGRGRVSNRVRAQQLAARTLTTDGSVVDDDYMNTVPESLRQTIIGATPLPPAPSVLEAAMAQGFGIDTMNDVFVGTQTEDASMESASIDGASMTSASVSGSVSPTSTTSTTSRKRRRKSGSGRGRGKRRGGRGGHMGQSATKRSEKGGRKKGAKTHKKKTGYSYTESRARRMEQERIAAARKAASGKGWAATSAASTSTSSTPTPKTSSSKYGKAHKVSNSTKKRKSDFLLFRRNGQKPTLVVVAIDGEIYADDGDLKDVLIECFRMQAGKGLAGAFRMSIRDAEWHTSNGLVFLRMTTSYGSSDLDSLARRFTPMSMAGNMMPGMDETTRAFRWTDAGLPAAMSMPERRRFGIAPYVFGLFNFRTGDLDSNKVRDTLKTIGVDVEYTVVHHRDRIVEVGIATEAAAKHLLAESPISVGASELVMVRDMLLFILQESLRFCYGCRRWGHISTECDAKTWMCIFCACLHNATRCPVRLIPGRWRCRSCRRCHCCIDPICLVYAATKDWLNEGQNGDMPVFPELLCGGEDYRVYERLFDEGIRQVQTRFTYDDSDATATASEWTAGGTRQLPDVTGGAVLRLLRSTPTSTPTLKSTPKPTQVMETSSGMAATKMTGTKTLDLTKGAAEKLKEMEEKKMEVDSEVSDLETAATASPPPPTSGMASEGPKQHSAARGSQCLTRASAPSSPEKVMTKTSVKPTEISKKACGSTHRTVSGKDMSTEEEMDSKLNAPTEGYWDTHGSDHSEEIEDISEFSDSSSDGVSDNDTDADCAAAECVSFEAEVEAMATHSSLGVGFDARMLKSHSKMYIETKSRSPEVVKMKATATAEVKEMKKGPSLDQTSTTAGDKLDAKPDEGCFSPAPLPVLDLPVGAKTGPLRGAKTSKPKSQNTRVVEAGMALTKVLPKMVKATKASMAEMSSITTAAATVTSRIKRSTTRGLPSRKRSISMRSPRRKKQALVAPKETSATLSKESTGGSPSRTKRRRQIKGGRHTAAPSSSSKASSVPPLVRTKPEPTTPVSKVKATATPKFKLPTETPLGATLRAALAPSAPTETSSRLRRATTRSAAGAQKRKSRRKVKSTKGSKARPKPTVSTAVAELSATTIVTDTSLTDASTVIPTTTSAVLSSDSGGRYYLRSRARAEASLKRTKNGKGDGQ